MFICYSIKLVCNSSLVKLYPAIIFFNASKFMFLQLFNLDLINLSDHLRICIYYVKLKIVEISVLILEKVL